MTMKFAVLLLLLTSSAACTSVPDSSDEFFTRTDTLSQTKGVRGKRIQTPAPNPAIPNGAQLIIEPARFLGDADISNSISEQERGLILNALGRALCADLSSQFEIVAGPATAKPPETLSPYRLRIGVSELTATGKVSAAVGTLSSFGLPVGVRPPFGLGALTVQLELVAPNNDQSAAMVWSRKADMVMTDASVSHIGDAYGFVETASSDFSSLIVNRTGMGNVRAAVTSSVPGLGPKSDSACEFYGEGAGRAARLVEFLGVPMPPTMSDKGAKPVP